MKTYYSLINKKSQKYGVFIKIRMLAKKPLFGKLFITLTLLILTCTTLIWSVLGALLQQNNADQLVNPFLYQTATTWHTTMLPAQHTFLIKWPLFYVIKLLGYTTTSYVVVTVISVLATVLIFAYIISRVERRPVALGTIYLALSSVLLLVPSQPYAGGILPVNMAMLTTRNLEYVLYILALYLIVRAKKLLGLDFLIAIILLALLLASDKLFLTVTIVGAIISLVVFSLRKRWIYVSLSAKWLVAGALSSVVAVLGLWLITHEHITRISSQVGIGPYSITSSSKSVFLGIFYAVTGIFTNFGANPGYDALTIRTIPSHFATNLLSYNGFSYAVNLIILCVCLFVSTRLILQSTGIMHFSKTKVADFFGLAVMLIWSSIAVFILFIASNHYYVVDARYLTLTLFSFFIALAVWSYSKKKINYELLSVVIVALLLSISLGVVGNIRTSSSQSAAYNILNSRNHTINDALGQHHVKYLVGDYWRVIPIKSVSKGTLNVVPLERCTEVRNVLSSKTWQPDLNKNSFAYLLTLHGSLTDFPNCDINKIAVAYGLPNSSVLISGKLGNPDELLLFYDNGIRHPRHHKITIAQASATVLPTSLSDLGNMFCDGTTIMNIVAHQDDDLLFMNPSVIHDIRAGYCQRTIYLTAGDAGSDSPYWLSREKGSEAAYSSIIGASQIWIQRTIRLPEGQYITLDQPLRNKKISLIFMHLPDGNVKGDGFGSTYFQSLAKLNSKEIKLITTVDKQSSYSSSQLVNGLTSIMHTFLPTQIRTQSSLVGDKYPDHSDHINTGRFASQARVLYDSQQFANQLQIPITYFVGYPIHGFTSNITGQDLSEKINAFLAYSKYDGGVCHGLKQCQNTDTYGSYLAREYQNPF